jgi:uncharacterized damage-inducible protein DinB
MSVRHLYYGYERVARRLVEGVRDLDAEALALGPPNWPVWAIASHVAGTRVYWLCRVAGEPGWEATPFARSDDGREDHLDHPRSAAELVAALESTWPIVAAALDRWTEPMLVEKVERRWGDVVQHHSRASIPTRLATHEGFHTGEVSVILGSHGLPPVDPWDRPNPDPDPVG